MTCLRAAVLASGISLTLGLACDDGARSREDGSTALQIKAMVDSCPVIKSVMVSPSTVLVGQAAVATAVATDQDAGDKLTFTWTAPTGTFATPALPSSPYTCAQAGASVLTVKVSDGRCDSQANVTVTCQPLP